MDRPRATLALVAVAGLMLVVAAVLSIRHTIEVRERRAYERAIAGNSAEECIRFIERFPNSNRRPKVEDRLEDIEWSEARAAGTLEPLQALLDKYPEGRHVAEIYERMEVIEWGAAQALDTVGGYRGFLEQFPGGRHVAEAEQAIESLELVKRCPFRLQPGEEIGLSRTAAEKSFTISIESGGMTSVEAGSWAIKGVGGEYLKIETRTSGNPLSGSFSLKILWQDQPFELHHKGSLVRAFDSTAGYGKVRS